MPSSFYRSWHRGRIFGCIGSKRLWAAFDAFDTFTWRFGVAWRGGGETRLAKPRRAANAAHRPTVGALGAPMAGEMYLACNNVKSLKCSAAQHETGRIIDPGLP
jgi:hypothetical protein